MLINLDFFKTFLNFLKATPRDWEEKNKESLGYIKNKPFYIEEEKTNKTVVDIIPQSDYEFVQFSENISGYMTKTNQTIIIGNIYSVIIDDVVYENLICYDDDGFLTIGAPYVEIEEGINTIPFQVYREYDNILNIIVTRMDSNIHNVRVYTEVLETAPSKLHIKSKYLPHFQGNWEENDETKVGYIQNKPFYISQEETITEVTEIMPETTLEFEGQYRIEDGSIEFSLEIGQFYTVTWNGVTYENLVCSELEGLPAIGTSDFSFTDYPFAIVSGISVGFPMIVFMTIDPATSHTISVSSITAKHIPEEMYMDSKFLKHFQSDWNEIDETNVSYIKNKPFYHIQGYKNIVPETTVYVYGDYEFYLGAQFEVGETYDVLFNGEEYKCVAWQADDAIMLGNGDVYGGTDINTGNVGGNGEPFSFDSYSDGNCYINIDGDAECTFKVSGNVNQLKKIDDKFQHQSDWNEVNPKKASYLLNRPFGEYISEESESIFDSTIYVEYDSEGFYDSYWIEDMFELYEGDFYKVTFNGKTYDKVICYINYYSTIGSLEEYPFMIEYDQYWNEVKFYFSTDEVTEDGDVEIKIEKYNLVTKKLDEKYIPQSNWDEVDEENGTFILNKPFGNFKGYEYVNIIEEDFVYPGGNYNYRSTADNELKDGETYRVIINENIYDVECFDDDGEMCLTDRETFYIYYGNGNIVIYLIPGVFGDNENISVVVQTQQLVEYIKKIDEKYLPEISSKNVTEENITLKDTVNGYEYIIEMQNGQLVSYCKTEKIELASMPNKTEYIEGDKFDPTGMVIVATRQDGTTYEINDYDCSKLETDSTSVVISYVEGASTFTVEVPVTVEAIEPILIDFYYNKEEDGTYTLTSWKGTLNGEPSTEILIPNYKFINI